MLKPEEFNETTDEELVKMVLEQGHGYFLQIMKRYESKLLRYVKRLSNVSHEDAEDLLQEIFIKVYQNLNSFSGKYKFSAWIYRIAHNEIISNYRKLKAKGKDSIVKIDDELFNEISSDLDLNKEIDRRLLGEAILEQILALDNKYKEVLILKYFEDKDYREISFILKKPLGTVGTLIGRAKKQLKDKLENKQYDRGKLS